MQHYAIKTIENIGSQAGAWATRFGSSEVVSYLITIWQGSKNDNIRATAASTLSRLMRHSPPLLAPMLEKYSLKPVVQGMHTLQSVVRHRPVQNTWLICLLTSLLSKVRTLYALVDLVMPVLIQKRHPYTGNLNSETPGDIKHVGLHTMCKGVRSVVRYRVPVSQACCLRYADFTVCLSHRVLV